MKAHEYRTYQHDHHSFFSPSIAIIDSKQIPYDACSKNYPEPFYKESMYLYIGKGYIFSINGVKQIHTKGDVMHFWRKINK